MAAETLISDPVEPGRGQIYGEADDFTELRPALADAHAEVVELEHQLRVAQARLLRFRPVEFELERRASEFGIAWAAMIQTGAEWPETEQHVREQYLDRCWEIRRQFAKRVEIARSAVPGSAL